MINQPNHQKYNTEEKKLRINTWRIKNHIKEKGR